MISNELEHLKIVLDKKPIVATRTAEDLHTHPEDVYRDYMEHVRSFVVLGRLNATDDGQPTVEDYEKRLIRLVKERRVAKGYITAEYGYGKTSTSIFIWQQCEKAEILSVPPFKLESLHELITATYGWIRFKLSQNYPSLISEADAIYNRYVQRSIETETSNKQERELLRRLHTEGRYNLGLNDYDYLHFFEEMTGVALKAHYQGLIVFADELQQYLETNRSQNALAKLFNIIQALMSRQGSLSFGLILSVARQDLGVMGNFRSDLVQRLKSDGLALDLGQIYNQTFAGRLWNQLAQELGFASLAGDIALSETLDALGQISARADLANGPRTVVDVFKLMAGRYTESHSQQNPFTPIDLIDAFLRGDIRYDNTGRLQQVIKSHLEQHFVQRSIDYQKAVKLMAAFPIGGLSHALAEKYDVWKAIESLTVEARGDIVTFAGGGYDAQGHERETRALLVGMEDRKINTDWLTTTIREFTRSYHEQSSDIINLAIEGFRQLLRSDIFKEGSWDLLRGLDRNLSQDRACIFEGAFTTTAKRYPARCIHVRILLEDEPLRDTTIDGDIALNLRLMLYIGRVERERHTFSGLIMEEEDKTTTLALNLSHHSGMSSYNDLNGTLGQVIAPSTINPIMLLSLYAFLDRKREAGVMPKDVDEMIRSNFQPLLLDHARQELFNADLGKPFNGVNGVRIVEEVVRRQLENSYPDYKTLMVVKNWKHSLREYRDALNKLSTVAERQGKQPFEAKKPELASLFGRTSPAMDTFLSNYSLLIKSDGNGWRFTLHPLETYFLNFIRKSIWSEHTKTGEIRHYSESDIIIAKAKALGYREDEVKEAIELLEVRGLISMQRNRTRIIEEVTHIPQIEELRKILNEYTNRLQTIKVALSEDEQVIGWLKERDELAKYLEKLARIPDDQGQIRTESLIKKRQDSLSMVIQKEAKRFIDEISPLLKNLVPTFSTEILQKPLNDGLFSSQLDTQRLGLLKGYQETIERLTELEQKLRTVYNDFQNVSDYASRLTQAIGLYHRVQRDMHPQQERIAHIKDLVQHYDNAQRLLSQAQNLQERMQKIPLQIVNTSQQALQTWSLQVISKLSSAKLNGLEEEVQWRKQFDQIEHDFQQKLQLEEGRFTTIQANYRNFLRQYFPTVTMWSPIAFNVSYPEDSYERLWEGVHGVLQSVVNDLNVQASATNDRAIRLMNGADHLPPNEHTEWKAFVSKLQEETGKYLGTTTKWLVSVSANEFMLPVKEQGSTKLAEEVLHNVVTQITKLIAHLPQIITIISEHERKVVQAKLSPAEEIMQTALRNLQLETGDQGSVELGHLLQYLEKEGVPKDQWQVLASLYSRQRLSIKVSLTEYN